MVKEELKNTNNQNQQQEDKLQVDDWSQPSQRKNKKEGEWKGTDSASSFRSQQLEDRSKREKHLDMLARLFTGDETCVAVCYHEEKLFISSNEEEPKHAKEYMKNLQEFANRPTLESYERLLELSVQQICLIEPENIERIGNTELLDKFREIAQDYGKKITLKQKPSWESLPKIANELFLEVKKAEEERTEESQKWKFLIPWHDTRKIAKAIVNKDIDDDILKAIESNSIEYIKGRHIFGPNSTEKTKLKLHAEMGMIEKLLDETNIQYIGSTKFSCDDCYAVIKLLNGDLFDNLGLFSGSEREICGRHGKGKIYSDKWLTPIFIKGWEDKIKKWKDDNPAKERILETTSKVSKKENLSNPVELLKNFQETPPKQ